VRQGDPLSPLLLNIVADCLTRIILEVKNNNLLTGLVKHLIPKGVAVLQYVDDTILCLEHNLTYARYVKLLMYVFEQLSGLKTNFDKSEVLLIRGGGGFEIAKAYADVFTCQIGMFPLKYLGSQFLAADCTSLIGIGWKKNRPKS
jgi:hypothetical protein